ncbi:hypothetical protein ACIRJO_37335 [Streptomyces sp. NPDC102394]
MTDEIKYEYKTVRAVRGTNGLVISKMQADQCVFFLDPVSTEVR